MSRRPAAILVVVTVVLCLPLFPARGDSGSESPSAIGNKAVIHLSVSPAFAHTGFAVAVVGEKCGDKNSCLFVTRDGGATWREANADGWGGGRVFAAATSDGDDVLLAESGSKVERSDDRGETWRQIGGPSTPTPLPTFAEDEGVAIAGGDGDQLVTAGGTHDVEGSGGELLDLSFSFSPDYPSGGAFSPALLAAADRDTGLPVIQRCDADLKCDGHTTLAGSSTFSAPGMALLPASDYATSGVVFARTGRGIYKSVNGAKSFAPLNIGEAGATATATAMMGLDPDSDTTAYVAVLQIFNDATNPAASHSSGGIYKTTNGGATWKRVGSPSPLDDGAFSVAISPTGRLFAGYGSGNTGRFGLLCSDDGGETWQAACSPVGDGTASASPNAGGASPDAEGEGEAKGAPSPHAKGQTVEGETSPADAPDDSSSGGKRANPAASRRQDNGDDGLPVPLIAVLAVGAAVTTGTLIRRRRSRGDAPPT